MSKPVTLVLLGADRVGKSTIAANTLVDLDCRGYKGYKAMSLHFSGPKPWHSSPIEQYTEELDKALTHAPKVIICDRFGAEVAFYDKFRRNVDISHEWAQAVEAYFAQRSKEVQVYMVKRDWEWSRHHHIIEIRKEFPDCSLWWMKTQLAMRKAEHEAYYEYMLDYLKNYSMLPYEILEKTSSVFHLGNRVSDV